MARLPLLSGDEVIKALQKLGYKVRGQRGSHISMRHKALPPITVPRHKELDKGTLRGIIRDIGISVDKFVELL